MSSCSSSSATAIAGMAYFSPTRTTTRNVFLFRSFSISSLSPNWVFLGKKLSIQNSPTFSHLLLRFPGRSLRPRRPVKPVMEWQDCSVKMEIDVPVSVAYNCYSDREAIPKWMPFISTVQILEDKPDLSRWSLKYKALGRDIEFSWLARNMQPITNQKIHWRSMEGLPNRGAVRFYPKGPSSCTVELTVSYEVPQILTPVASALKPLLEELLRRGLERFATFAKSYA